MSTPSGPTHFRPTRRPRTRVARPRARRTRASTAPAAAGLREAYPIAQPLRAAPSSGDCCEASERAGGPASRARPRSRIRAAPEVSTALSVSGPPPAAAGGVLGRGRGSCTSSRTSRRRRPHRQAHRAPRTCHRCPVEVELLLQLVVGEEAILVVEVEVVVVVLLLLLLLLLLLIHAGIGDAGTTSAGSGRESSSPRLGQHACPRRNALPPGRQHALALDALPPRLATAVCMRYVTRSKSNAVAPVHAEPTRVRSCGASAALGAAGGAALLRRSPAPLQELLALLDLHGKRARRGAARSAPGGRRPWSMAAAPAPAACRAGGAALPSRNSRSARLRAHRSRRVPDEAERVESPTCAATAPRACAHELREHPCARGLPTARRRRRARTRLDSARRAHHAASLSAPARREGGRPRPLGDGAAAEEPAAPLRARPRRRRRRYRRPRALGAHGRRTRAQLGAPGGLDAAGSRPCSRRKRDTAAAAAIGAADAARRATPADTFSFGAAAAAPPRAARLAGGRPRDRRRPARAGAPPHAARRHAPAARCARGRGRRGGGGGERERERDG